MMRIAIAGFGGYGWELVQHIRAVSKRVDCRLAAAADARLSDVPEKAEDLSKSGVRLFDDAFEMIRQSAGLFDVIYIATSIASHADLVCAAAGAGLHMHLEKPPAATIQEVDRMIAAVDKGGRMCLVGFQALHSDDVHFVPQLVAQGRLGRIRTIACHAGWPRKAEYYTRNDWAGKLRGAGVCGTGVSSSAVGVPPASSSVSSSSSSSSSAQQQQQPKQRQDAPVRATARAGGTPTSLTTPLAPIRAAAVGAAPRWSLDGPATNALAHQIANMLCMASDTPGRLADPVSVRAELYAAGPVESHDTCAIEIRTAQGPVCYFLASHCTDRTFGPVIEVRADGGSARWDYGGGLRVQLDDGSELVCPHDGRQHEKMIENLLTAIATGDPSMLRCDLVQARKMVLSLNGAHESSRQIMAISPSYTRRVDEGTPRARTIVSGLDELLPVAAGRPCLFSDAPVRGAAPWAVARGSFDLAGYTSFPQLFDCD